MRAVKDQASRIINGLRPVPPATTPSGILTSPEPPLHRVSIVPFAALPFRLVGLPVFTPHGPRPTRFLSSCSFSYGRIFFCLFLLLARLEPFPTLSRRMSSSLAPPLLSIPSFLSKPVARLYSSSYPSVFPCVYLPPTVGDFQTHRGR